MIAKVLLFSLLFINCHKSGGKSAAGYFPNSIGDYWIYNATDSIAGSSNNPSTPNHYTVKVLVKGSEILADGKPASVWQYQYPFGTDTNFVRIEGDTVKVFSLAYSRTVTDLAYPRMIFLLPFQTNKRWDGYLLTTDSSRITADSSGIYTLYHHYIGPNTELNDTYWLQPNVGITAMRFKDYNNGPMLYRTWVLSNYHLQ